MTSACVALVMAMAASMIDPATSGVLHYVISRISNMNHGRFIPRSSWFLGLGSFQKLSSSGFDGLGRLQQLVFGYGLEVL